MLYKIIVLEEETDSYKYQTLKESVYYFRLDMKLTCIEDILEAKFGYSVVLSVEEIQEDRTVYTTI